MNSLTSRQRASLAGKSQAAKQVLIARYREQNSQPTAFGPRIRTPNLRSDYSPLSNRRQNATRTTQGNQLLPSPRPVVAAHEKGSCVIGTLSVQSASFTLYNQTCHPRRIPTLRPFCDLYQEWAFESINFRFVSTSSSKASGVAAVAFASSEGTTPSSMPAMLTAANVAVTSVHENSAVVQVPINKSNVWYQTSQSANTAWAVRHPGWIQCGVVSDIQSVAGYLRMDYSIKFRIRKPSGLLSSNLVYHPLILGDEDELPPVTINEQTEEKDIEPEEILKLYNNFVGQSIQKKKADPDKIESSSST